MNKNLIIGLLVIVVLGTIGYYAFKKNPSTVNQPGATTTSSTTTSSPPTQAVAGLPTATTSDSVVVSNATAAVTGEVKPNGASTTYWYEYGRTTTLGNHTVAQTIGSSFGTFTVPGYITGLRANTTYYFQLNAQNKFGTVHGAMFTFTTNNTTPPQGAVPTPHTTVATDITRTTANAKGTVNPNGAQTTYWFEYGEDNNLGNITAFQSAGNGTSSTSVTLALSGLRPLTKYYFRLNAQNAYGTVNGAIASFTTKGPQAPSEPSVDTTMVTDVTDSSATFNGRVNPNGVDTTYWFEYGTDSLLSNIIVSTTPVHTISGGTTTVAVLANVGNLDNGTNYYYRVAASNQYGTVRGDIVRFKTNQ